MRSTLPRRPTPQQVTPQKSAAATSAWRSGRLPGAPPGGERGSKPQPTVCCLARPPGALSFPEWPVRAERAASPCCGSDLGHFRLSLSPRSGHLLTNGRSGPNSGLGELAQRRAAIRVGCCAKLGDVPHRGTPPDRAGHFRNTLARERLSSWITTSCATRRLQRQLAMRPRRPKHRGHPRNRGVAAFPAQRSAGGYRRMNSRWLMRSSPTRPATK